ncbi:MAG: serine/threonine protein kinase [Gemmatimonadetes bacterium]|nr:serine/threonine protein kinase [Gemmatimonadota bacterium]
MAGIRCTLTDGRVLELEDEPVGTGAEKRVFLTRDRQYAVGFYHGHLADRRERTDRLTRILTTYNPTLAEATGDYWARAFCWPVGIADGERALPRSFAQAQQLVWPPLGVVTPAYRPGFYFTDRFGQRQEKEVRWFTGGKASRFVPREEAGTLLTRLQVAVRVARAVRRLHMAGLAHADLSHKNVLVDPRSGDACLIDIDALVVPGIAPPSVLGTPGYIAPEVLAGKAHPSIATDRHALAVLIYELLLQRHPLQGRRVNSTRSAEEDERLSMGACALFVEHPTDRRNPPVAPLDRRYAALGAALAQCVERTFVEGLHAPARRADAADWERALYRTLQWLVPTPSGGWILAFPGAPAQAWPASEPIPDTLLVARLQRDTGRDVLEEGDHLALFHHLRLHDWHLRVGVVPDERADRTPRGYVSQHQGRWWVVSTDDQPWQVVRPGGGEAAMVRRNGMVEALPGTRITAGESWPARVLQLQRLDTRSGRPIP